MHTDARAHVCVRASVRAYRVEVYVVDVRYELPAAEDEQRHAHQVPAADQRVALRAAAAAQRSSRPSSSRAGGGGGAKAAAAAADAAVAAAARAPTVVLGRKTQRYTCTRVCMHADADAYINVMFLAHTLSTGLDSSDQYAAMQRASIRKRKFGLRSVPRATPRACFLLMMDAMAGAHFSASASCSKSSDCDQGNRNESEGRRRETAEFRACICNQNNTQPTGKLAETH